jgi:hypothetical protein
MPEHIASGKHRWNHATLNLRGFNKVYLRQSTENGMFDAEFFKRCRDGQFWGMCQKQISYSGIGYCKHDNLSKLNGESVRDQMYLETCGTDGFR